MYYILNPCFASEHIRFAGDELFVVFVISIMFFFLCCYHIAVTSCNKLVYMIFYVVVFYTKGSFCLFGTQ